MWSRTNIVVSLNLYDGIQSLNRFLMGYIMEYISYLWIYRYSRTLPYLAVNCSHQAGRIEAGELWRARFERPCSDIKTGPYENSIAFWVDIGQQNISWTVQVSYASLEIPPNSECHVSGRPKPRYRRIRARYSNTIPRILARLLAEVPVFHSCLDPSESVQNIELPLSRGWWSGLGGESFCPLFIPAERTGTLWIEATLFVKYWLTRENIGIESCPD